jgi:acetyl-CoA carboxylase, biotin carboxylase subunit
VNTRIQVEHPVTEMITGIDLVQAMLRISDGDPLTVQQGEISRIGHAIECRINAEDPYNDFRPSPGRIERLEVPQSNHVRFDSHLFEGYIVPPFYDSLLGKLIVYGDDREQCLVRLRAALDALVIVGVPTTIPLHQTLAQQADVIGGQLHTGYLESWLESEFGRKPAFAGVAG